MGESKYQRHQPDERFVDSESLKGADDGNISATVALRVEFIRNNFYMVYLLIKSVTNI